MRLDLLAAPRQDIAAEGDGALARLRITGPQPRLALVAAGQAAFTLTPGAYAFVVELRGAAGAAPILLCESADGRVRRIALDADGAFGWRAALALAQTTQGLTLSLDGVEGPFIVAQCAIETEAPAPAASLRAALALGARAMFHKLPRGLRNRIGRAVARRRGLARVRAEMIAARENTGGRIALSNSGSAGDSEELAVRRADFEDRLAIARGLGEAPAPIAAMGPAGAKLVAFYLPQYHRIAENDAWWGDGFTEWTNVAKAVPQFLGHHQPRLPSELGFYDLTAPEALSRQVTLARAHGVSAFAFHYYWFAGKRLLERPLDAFIADPSLDLQFTLCWANENWTRRWDGAEHEILIAQRHSPEDHARVFDDLARYLEDRRAIRIDGKPMIIVYRPAIIEDAAAMTALWRARAAARGWPGLYLAATDAFQFDDPERLGFDGMIEFPPHGLTPARIEKRLKWINPEHRGAVFDYGQTAAEAIARLMRRGGARDVFPGVMPGWDNEARRPGAGNIFHDATPGAYARWLKAACDAAERTLPASRRMVFVNAWNEWAEGAYLEPDRKWGRAFLEATRAVMLDQSARVQR